MTPLVIDTAVAVKAVLPEEDSAAADALLDAAARGAHQLIAPDLMALEFGNVMWKHVQRSRMTAAEARRNVERFPFDRISWLPGRALLPGAMELALQFNITVYDGTFLAAAESLGVQFVTADQALHRKVSKHLPWVTLLSQLHSPES